MEELEKIVVLRNCEKDCYKACFYILDHTPHSVEAAKKVLCEVFYREDFYKVGLKEQKKIIQEVAIKYSLQLLIQLRTGESN